MRERAWRAGNKLSDHNTLWRADRQTLCLPRGRMAESGGLLSLQLIPLSVHSGHSRLPPTSVPPVDRVAQPAFIVRGYEAQAECCYPTARHQPSFVAMRAHDFAPRVEPQDSAPGPFQRAGRGPLPASSLPPRSSRAPRRSSFDLLELGLPPCFRCQLEDLLGAIVTLKFTALLLFLVAALVTGARHISAASLLQLEI